jgi:hypothetical protein
MKYYLFLFCFFANSSSMAMLENDDNARPSSSLSAPSYYNTNTSDFPYTELHTLNSPLEFDAILENPEPAIWRLKFNFTPTISQLSRLTNQLPTIQFLDLSGTDVTDHEITPLTALKALEYLDLSSTNVRAVEAVFNRRGQENATSELEGNIFRPSSHPNLSINLRYTLKNFSEPTSNDVEFKWDTFSHQFIVGDDIEEVESVQVKGPKQLYTLLNHPNIQRVRGLELLFPAKLKHIQHITSRVNMSNLIILGLPYSAIKDVSTLGRLERLRFLDLSFTGIKDISFLAMFKQLHTLLLNNTDVEDLSSLAELKDLRDLYLNNTSIQDLWPLATLDRLESLEIKNTAITNLLPLCHRNKMKIYTNIGRILNGQNLARTASRQLEEDRGNIHRSFFDHLWLQLSPGLEQES